MSAETVTEIVELYDRWAADHYDEQIAQLDHALQSAALAVDEGASDTLVAAALLHDVGHLLDLDRPTERNVDLRHEDSGAAWLRPLLPSAVTAPIALHVRAKRYLCAVEPDYVAILSPGSIRSLELQGGAMSETEVAAFEVLPGHADAVRLRRWDDAAKVVGLEVPRLDTYVDLLEHLASTS